MSDRRARGVVYTPRAIAAALARAVADGAPHPTTVCDPAAGDGRLLAAMADELDGPARYFGADLDGVPPVEIPVSWARGDTLAAGTALWADAPPDGFDLVIGNPPFRNQLEHATRLSEEERRVAQGRYGSVARGYADTAAMFLVAACEMAASTGRIAMIMPMSFLAARDAAPARRRALELASLAGVWIAPRRVFPDASVNVCAVILDRGGPRRRLVQRWVGEAFVLAEPVEVDSDELAAAGTWSHLVTTALGVPDVALPDDAGVLGDLVSATAGFRGEYYGLAPLLVEDDGRPGLAPLVTCGLVDPGRSAWGSRPATIARRQWQRPAVPVDALDPDDPLARWVTARRTPKLLVATQTRVIEAAPDPDGVAIPSTPVIAAHADGADLWRSLAVLLAPPTTAWVLARSLGSALSVGAVKLTASLVTQIPLPTDRSQWDDAARRLEATHRTGGIDEPTLLEVGQVMSAAYGAGPEVFEWWRSRLGA